MGILDVIYNKFIEFRREKNISPKFIYLGYEEWMALKESKYLHFYISVDPLNNNKSYQLLGIPILLVEAESHINIA